MRASVRGAGGASSGTTATLGGRGGSGALIGATFKVLPLQAVTGAVGAGGAQNNTNTVATGGVGYSDGGNGGLIGAGSSHRGGGGGGSSALVVAGIPLIVAGGGGGGGAAHDAPANGNGGAAGFAGIAPGAAAAGTAGSNGLQTGATVGGGGPGLAGAPGAGGTLTPASVPTSNGFPGVGGKGGAGGTDSGFDSGGGGGGGYFGGGGGAATSVNTVTGAGGGGGSSFISAIDTSVLATAPTAASGAAGPVTAGGSIAGAAGLLSIDWVPCIYTLSVSKSASPATLAAGSKTTWTVTVTNTGPDPMTRGDSVTIGDLLPVGPNGSVPTQFKVLSLATSGGTNSDMSSGAVTCTGVAVGSAMPASTVCTRPYAAPAAPGAPSGGTRGLNSGESLTITYEQVIANTAPCGNINNTASTVDRSTSSGTTDIIGVNAPRSATAALTVNCYDLQVSKSYSPVNVGAGFPLTWTIAVTNNGPGPMAGPDDPATNPLIVTDAAPTVNVSTPTAFTSSGPAGACTYAANTITCPGGLASGETQIFTFKQTVNAGAPNGAVIANTVSVSDSKSGDSNDSSMASATVVAVASLTLTKISNGDVGGFTFTGNNAWASQTITTVTPGVGVVGATQAIPAASATTITETAAPGYAVTAISCSGYSGATAPTYDNAARSVTIPVSATVAGSNIACTFTNAKLPTVKLTKVSNGGVGAFTFTGDNGWSSQTITTASSGTGVQGAVQTLAAAATPTTITETIPSGYALTSVNCTGLGTGGSFTPNLTTGAVAFDAAATAAGSNIACTFTNGFIAISISKTQSGGPNPVTAAGQTLSYTINVTNSGGAPLSTVILTDALTQGASALVLTSGPARISGDTNGNSVLDVAETWVYAASYLVPQAVVDTGTILSNTASVDTDQTAPLASAAATTSITQNPDISILKTADKAGPLVKGDVVTFSYLVTNTGNVTLSGVAISETAFNGVGGPAALTPAGGSTTLAPGASTTFTATYTVTQDDVDLL